MPKWGLVDTAEAPSPPRWILGVTLAVVILAILLFAWLPFDPLEPPAPRLDRMIPVSVDLAVRFDGKAALGSPFAASVWDHPEVLALRERFDVEGRIVRPMREVEATVREATFGAVDPPSLERDLIPAEVVCALNGDDLLVVTRISSRARALEFVRQADADGLRAHGVTVEGEFLHVRRESGDLWIARRSDALVVSTSRALAFEAILCADRGGMNSLAERADYGDALHLGSRAGQRAYLWADPLPLAGRLRQAASIAAHGEAPWWVGILEARPKSFRAEADLSDGERLRVTISVPFEPGGMPPILQALDCRRSPEASELERSAARYAVEGETFAAGGTTAHVARVVEALLRSMPPEHQAVAEQALAQAGESVETVAGTLAHHFDDGVGFLVSRLGEITALQRENDEPGAVHAIPATVVVFRLRDPVAGGEAAIAEVRRRAKVLFDAELSVHEEQLPGGARLFALGSTGLGGQWALLRPAFAIDGERFLFATHEGHLRRALAAELRGLSRAPLEARTFAARISSDPLRALIDDMRWEAADRATFHDWAAERRALEAELRAEGVTDPVELADTLDHEVRARVEHRRRQEIPDAAEDHRTQWRWIRLLGDGDVGAELRGGELEVTGTVSLRR